MRRAFAAPGRAAQTLAASRAAPTGRRATPPGTRAMAAAAVGQPLTGNPEVTKFIEDTNTSYERAHVTYEDAFWASKMGLKEGSSSEVLAASKTRYDCFLANPELLRATRAHLGDAGLSAEQRHVLQIFEKTFACYCTESAEAAALKAELNELEAGLQAHRNSMALGYTAADGSFVPASAVQLRNAMRTGEEEAQRRAAYEGLCSIGPHIAERLCVIVRKRNQLARALGFGDYYDMKVTQAENMSKAELFKVLDGLESRTRGLMASARDALAAAKGAVALQPWNTGAALSGDVERALDPYFPFSEAVDVWARCFAALGISYRGATMTLDLLDRPGKYSNGFCHWPQPAWVRADGSWVPSRANFTSLATPAALGSGKTALVTLLHEGGHAAHFANILQRSPLFAQERAPFSVALAENQSMFLDSLAGDAAWLGRYARARDGAPVPWALLEEKIRATQPYDAFTVRTMLSVPYFERALYELPDSEVTPAALLALAARVEGEVEGGPAPRPLLSVPHILSDESSAYYHGYVLAEMSVHQTRAHFLRAYGAIVDNPRVGADLAATYWLPGNGEPFLGLVQRLTGAPLSADAWVAELEGGLEGKVEEERREYDAAVAAGPRFPPGSTDFDLDMTVRLVHGDEEIADSARDGSLAAACAKYRQYVDATADKK